MEEEKRCKNCSIAKEVKNNRYFLYCKNYKAYVSKEDTCKWWGREKEEED